MTIDEHGFTRMQISKDEFVSIRIHTVVLFPGPRAALSGHRSPDTLGQIQD